MDYLQKVFLEGASTPSNSNSNSNSNPSSSSITTTNPSTKDPLLTASAGEIVNSVENQMLHDYSVLGADGFINKYGLDTYKSFLNQSEQAMGAVRASRIANSGSLGDIAGDSVKNIITGALGGLTDTGAFVAGMTGMDTLAKGLSYASEGIRKAGDALGSDAEQAKRRLYAFKQQGLKNRIDREYEEDIASGKSTTEAELARIGKQFGGTVGNAFSSGHALELGTSGLGSLITGGAVSKGIGLGAKATKSFMPKVASGVDAFAKSNKVAEKIVKNSPWMASMGAQEGGGAYSQQLLEGLSMSIEDLRAHSPQFNTAVKQYVEQGYSLPEAEQKAKEDMAFAAARQASLETAAAAFVANALTSPLSKMTRGDKTLSRYIGEALGEPVEEGITEGLGQIAGNKATRDYLDQRQTLMEDVGQSAAEGAVGGLGIVGARSVIPAAELAVQTATQGAKELGVAAGNLANTSRTTKEISENSPLSTGVGQSPLNLEETGDKEEATTLPNDSVNIEESSVNTSILKDSIEEPVSQEQESPKKIEERHSKATLDTIRIKSEKQEEVTSDDVIDTLPEATNVYKEVENGSLSVDDPNVGIANAIFQYAGQLTTAPVRARPTYGESLTAEQAKYEAIALALLSDKGASAINSFITMSDGENDLSLKPEHLNQVLQGSYTPAIDEKLSEIKELLGVTSPKESNEYKVLGTDLPSTRRNTDGGVSSSFTLSNGSSKIPVKISMKGDSSGTIETNGKKVSFTSEEGKSISKGGSVSAIDFARSKLGIEKSYKLISEKNLTGRNAEDLLNDPNSSGDTVALIQNELKKRGLTVEEDSDSGYKTVREVASEETEKSFKQSFGEKISSLFKVVKRPLHIWEKESPLQEVHDLFSSPERIKNVLKSNKFANERKLTNTLFEPTYEYNPDSKTWEPSGPSLADEVANVIAPDSFLASQIYEPIAKNLTFDKDMPIEGKKKLEDICKLAAIQFIANVAAYQHVLTPQELEKFGFMKDNQNNLLETGTGLYEQMGLQNLATLIRKFMGVSPNNDAIGEDVEKFFAQKALEVAEGLLDSGVLSQTPITLDAINGYDAKGKPIPNAVTVNFFTLSEDFTQANRLFKRKTDILEAILNPYYKNQIHHEVPEAKNHINHSSIKVSRIQQKAIKALNKVEHHINVPFYNLMRELGESGITELFDVYPTKDTRLLMTQQDFIHRRGQLQSRSLAFEYLANAIGSDDPNSTVVYFSNVALRNGRIMQEGMATYQNNKLLRQALNVGPLVPRDLTNELILNSWKATIAQNLGISINKRESSKYLKTVDQAIDFIQKDPKISDILQKNPRSKDIKEFIKAFNKEFEGSDLKIKDFESLNAIIEICRYLEATPEERKSFITRVYAEIDGINDGPSNINSFFAPVVGSLSPEFIKSKAKTGMYFTNSVSQKMLDPSESNSELYGTHGSDFHREVAETNIPKLLLTRLIETKKAAQKSNVGAVKTKATNIENTLKAFLTICQAIGWLKEGSDIKKALSLTELPKNLEELPIRFSKDISKKLATIIPYGSSPAGATAQVVNLLLDGQYSKGLFAVISDKLIEMDSSEKVSFKDQLNPRFNGVSYSDLRKSLISLLADPEKGYSGIESDQVDTYIEGLPDTFILLKELKSPEWNVDSNHPEKTIFKYDKDRKTKVTNDIRNLRVTTAGYKRMADALQELIGEPAHTAVTQTIGSQAMHGAKIPMAMGDLMSISHMLMEAFYAKKEGKPLAKLSNNTRYVIEAKLRKIAPYFEFKHGAVVVAEKTKPSIEADPLLKSKRLKYHSSTTPLTNVGVSSGALVVQASGDGTMIYSMSNSGQVIWGSVYDGVYVPVGEGEKVGKIANKGCAYAQNEPIMQSLNKSFNRSINALYEQLKEFLKEDFLKANNITNGEDALIFALQSAVSGTYPDGSAMEPEIAKNFKDIGKAISKDLRLFRPEDKFDPSLIDEPALKSSKFSAGKVVLTGSTAKKNHTINKELRRVFDLLKVYEANEKVNKKALNMLPQVFHHMSAFESTYSTGDVITEERAKELLKEINSKVEEKFDDFSELISAYLNTLSNIYAKDITKNFTEEQKKIWNQIRGLDNANSSARTLNFEAMLLVKDALAPSLDPKIEKKNPKNPTYIDPKTAIALNAAKKVLASKGEHSNAIWKSVFSKIGALLPNAEDIEIYLVSSEKKLPSSAQVGATNSARQAYYEVIKGKPRIYIIDQSGKKDINNTKNLELLVHELIHASISSVVQNHFNKDSKIKISSVQARAIDNLVKLLDQFESKEWNTEDGTPTVIEGFKRILKKHGDNPAVRVDEALAYILSNQDLFDAISKADTDVSSWKEQQSDLQSLLGKIKTYAKNIFRSILNLISGSKLDTVNAKEAFGRAGKDINLMKFLELFGTNTHVIFAKEEHERDRDPRRTKKLINSDLDGRNAESLLGELPPFVDRVKNIKTYVGRKVLRFFNPIRTKVPQVKKIQQAEVDKWNNYRDNLAHKLSSLGLDGDFLSEKIVDLQLPHDRFLNRSYKRDLTKVFNEIIDRLPEDFLILDPSKATKEDYERSKELHSYITGSKKYLDTLPFLAKPISNKGEFEAQAIFFTLATYNPEFFNSIGAILHKPGKKASDITIKSFKDAIQKLDALINDSLEKDIEASSASDLIKNQLEENKKLIRETRHNPIGKVLSLMDDALINTGVGAVNLARRVVKKDPLNKEIVNEFRDSPINLQKGIGEVTRKLVNKFAHPMIISNLSELYGRLPSNTYIQSTLKKIKGFYDKIRKMNLEDMPKILSEHFKHHKITLKDRKFFDWVLGQTDISVLSNDLHLAEQCLTDKKALENNIEKFEADLRSLDLERFSKYQKHMKQLANYLCGTRESGNLLLTNALAISQLLGEDYLRDVDDNLVAKIDQLTTLYCLSFLSEADRAKLKEFYSTDREAMNHLIKTIAHVKEKEAQRIEETRQQETEEKIYRNKSYIYNSLKGWRPSGNQPKGHYVLVPKSKQLEFEKKGYMVQGDYVNSNIDTSEPMVRMFTEWPLENDFQEGIIQGITQTAWGYQIDKGTRGEVNGTRIYDTDVAQQIFDNLSKETSTNGVIPVWSPDGEVIGFERAVPPEDRALIEKHNDLFSGLAQYIVRQERERVAGVINKDLINHVAADYNNATESEKKEEFIDVFHSDLGVFKEAVKRLDKKTLARIERKFGKGHFYLRKDTALSVLGYYRLSAHNMWDGKFVLPEKAERVISAIFDKVLGKKARWWIGHAENVWKGFVTWGRETIIIRSMIVPAINIASNVLMLNTALQIPFTDIWRLFKECYKDTEDFNALFKKLSYLQDEQVSATGPRAEELKVEILKVKRAIDNNPLSFLIKSGEYSTISAEGQTFEELDITKQKFGDVIETIVDKMPKELQSLGGNLLLTRNSDLFKALAKATNYGDWIAKSIGFRYLTEISKSRKSMLTDEEARDIVSTLFVDYDQFTGRERDYLNSMGLTWFFTYKYRMIPAAILGMLTSPARMLLTTMLATSVGSIGTPLSDNFLTKLFTGNIQTSIGLDMLWRSFSLHPLSCILGLAK